MDENIDVNVAHVLLTGRPGCGKTTVIKRAVAGRADAGGFYTAEIRKGGKRTGFSINTLDGQEGVLASTDIKSKFRVGRYRINVKDIEGIAVTSIMSAINDPEINIIVIDEIASMELACESFKNSVSSALDSGKRVLGTIQARQDPFLDSIRSKPSVSIVKVDSSNRDVLPESLRAWIEGAS